VAEGAVMKVQLHEANAVIFKIDERTATCVLFPPEGLDIDLAAARILDALGALKRAHEVLDKGQ
jgi:hypothetical protein